MESVYNYLDRVWDRFNCGVPMLLVMTGILISNLLLFYILFYTKFWFLPALYLLWMFTLDKDSCEKGGRKTLPFRRYLSIPSFSKYFPLKFMLSSPYKLDLKKNYLFCCYPHGVLPYGVGKIFISNNGGFKEFFPDHSYRIATLGFSFYYPCVRELLLLVGMISVSEKSLNYVLGDRNGGNAVAVVLGGAKEIYYSDETDYHIILKRRKGFVRVALKNGAPLIPVFQFGVNNIYKTYKIQCLSWMETVFGVPPILINGRGLFQKWFGPIPLASPITTIAGEPIEVERVENPSQLQIDELHIKFTEALVKLYEEHKLKYVPNAENVKLVIH